MTSKSSERQLWDELQLIKEVDDKGTIRHYNADHQLHREDGPAVIRPNGTKEWYVNGLRHREDGPAIIWANGTQAWCVDDKLHREDGPALFWVDGTEEWWINGKQIR